MLDGRLIRGGNIRARTKTQRSPTRGGTPAPARGGPPPARRSPAPTAHDRFLELDAYRAQREWFRYEGNALRDLFRQLRGRFLLRHRTRSGWAVDLGAGPGRFTDLIGGPPSRVVQLDLSVEMLREAEARREGYHRVRGDVLTPPFPNGRFMEVVLLGNVLGQSGPDAGALLSAAGGLVAPGGRLLLEIVSGHGERSMLLHRLSGERILELLSASDSSALARVEREGFEPVHGLAPREHGFRRLSAAAIQRRLGSSWRPVEVLAVAPGLGFDASKLEPIRRDPAGWSRLLRLEEELGRRPARWRGSAGLLLSIERAPA
ncbi:MAG: class I SAM-dependent methyltransferase [Thermoplasmata archaeon]